ncbi:MAG TPA: 16S rRNA (cytosine(967)-C(5))-methyltransferase RsmB [Candidatus Humimicrobiaceae bacterium]|nr:16S rRNA (cytosine(967)-C(5))-methyltransferase RsmB [Candidatus Humimicrobiaceae bacterium]
MNEKRAKKRTWKRIQKKIAINPRKAAFLILTKYFKEKKSLKDIINSSFEAYKLSGLDRRFIFNIVKGTVRYYLKIDLVLSLFSARDIKDIDFTVKNILRMGVYQLLYMDKIPDYSTVNESVELTRENVSISSSKFVNAILRKISSTADIDSFINEEIKRQAKDDADRMSIDYSYPDWLIRYWVDWYGVEKTSLICRTLNENPHTYLRFNKEKITREEVLKEPGMKSTASHDNVLTGSIEVSSVQDISETGIYRRGLISVQDLSSQIAVKYFMNPQIGEKILDTCAAPGGKTAYISELIGDRGEVISVDISRKRIKILENNLGRLNSKNVKLIEADVTKKNFLDSSKPGSYAGYFDKILIDVPCSAFGTISKNPDAKYNKTMDDLMRLSEISFRMMVNCDIYLKTGGRIIFYTCTLSPIENQQVIDRFLKEFKGKYIVEKPGISDKLKLILDSKENNMPEKSPETCSEIMPYYFGSEGGFICILRKHMDVSV